MVIFGYYFGIAALVNVAASIFFGVHAARTGRYFWIWLILFIPYLGWIIYLIAEYLPEVRGGERARRVADKVADTVATTLDPGKHLRELEARLRLTPSFANRQAVAEAYLALGRLDEAIALFAENTKGAHSEDPSTMRGLAQAWFKKGDMEKAKDYALRWRKRRESTLAGDMDMLYARILENTGELDAAVAEYRSLAKKSGAEEARYRAGVILKALGRGGEARAEFEEMVKNAELMPAHYQKSQKAWIDLAKKELR